MTALGLPIRSLVFIVLISICWQVAYIGIDQLFQIKATYSGIEAPVIICMLQCTHLLNEEIKAKLGPKLKAHIWTLIGSLFFAAFFVGFTEFFGWPRWIFGTMATMFALYSTVVFAERVKAMPRDVVTTPTEQTH